MYDEWVLPMLNTYFAMTPTCVIITEIYFFFLYHLNENIENCLLKGEGTGKPSHFYIKNKIGGDYHALPFPSDSHGCKAPYLNHQQL